MFFLDGTIAPQVVSDKVPAEDIGIAPFPFDNDKTNRYIVYKPETALGISKTSKYPEAAMAFFNFMMDTKYIDYVERNSLISARTDLQADVPFFQNLETDYTFEKMVTPPKQNRRTRLSARDRWIFPQNFKKCLPGAM